MPKERIRNYLSANKRYRHLTVLTGIMFIFLVLEKAIVDLFDISSLSFAFTFNLKSIISILIYLSMAILIFAKVNFKYLLIPDTILLGLKLFTAVYSIVTLFSAENHSLLTQISLIEEATESLLFAVFLIIFFSGEIFERNHLFVRIIPYICICSLVFAFPTTVIFETVKMLIENTVYNYPIERMVFLFIKGVGNEALLDIPYYLLVFLVYFKPSQTRVR